MIYTISNDILTVKISDKGAELQSIKRNDDGCEYLWQGDAKYWEDRSPIMFPICSSVCDGKYNYKGKEYEMGLHGFAQYEIFSAERINDEELLLTLSSSDETKKIYPFDFVLQISYKIEGNSLITSATIKNTGNNTLLAAFGAHPGFNVPLANEGSFESYRIEFSEPSEPQKIILACECLERAGEMIPLALEDKKTLRLSHELFVIDGIFMLDMPKELTLCSDEASHSVKLKYDDMDYLGIWQEYGADTPFICIEPWCAPPTNDQRTREDLETKKGLFHIPVGQNKKVSYSIEFN